MRKKLLTWGVRAGLLAGLVVALFFGVPWLREVLKSAPAGSTEGDKKNQPYLDGRGTLVIHSDVMKSLSIQVARASKCKNGRGLAPLTGSLALDPNRLARVHARFSGEVIEVGAVLNDPKQRPLQFGDPVVKGQLLAVIWSKDLGEKKSELVDALSQLRLDREALARIEELYRSAAIAEARVFEARRAVESSLISASKAERTLRSWRVTDAEIADLYAEAKRLGQAGTKRDLAQEQSWACVEVRAPLAGTILEKNFVVGDIVDAAMDLFKIADLSRLTVWAHAYEEELPVLLNLPKPLRWTIRVSANNPQASASAGLAGDVDRVGDLVDPLQHTVLVTGFVDNADGRLRAGQFITATIDVPATEGEVEIPTSALIENGEESIVFVQPDPSKPKFALRNVKVLRRTRDVVKIAAGPVAPGDWVVSNGAGELRVRLEGLETAQAPAGQSTN